MKPRKRKRSKSAEGETRTGGNSQEEEASSARSRATTGTLADGRRRTWVGTRRPTCPHPGQVISPPSSFTAANLVAHLLLLTAASAAPRRFRITLLSLQLGESLPLLPPITTGLAAAAISPLGCVKCRKSPLHALTTGRKVSQTNIPQP